MIEQANARDWKAQIEVIRARQTAQLGLVEGIMIPDSPYSELADALEGRIKIIADREWYARDAAGHLQALQEISQKIEALAVQLPQPLPGDLAHYLQRRSYDKALAWIRERLQSG